MLQKYWKNATNNLTHFMKLLKIKGKCYTYYNIFYGPNKYHEKCYKYSNIFCEVSKLWKNAIKILTYYEVSILKQLQIIKKVTNILHNIRNSPFSYVR